MDFSAPPPPDIQVKAPALGDFLSSLGTALSKTGASSLFDDLLSQAQLAAASLPQPVAAPPPPPPAVTPPRPNAQSNTSPSSGSDAPDNKNAGTTENTDDSSSAANTAQWHAVAKNGSQNRHRHANADGSGQGRKDKSQPAKTGTAKPANNVAVPPVNGVQASTADNTAVAAPGNDNDSDTANGDQPGSVHGSGLFALLKAIAAAAGISGSAGSPPDSDPSSAAPGSASGTGADAKAKAKANAATDGNGGPDAVLSALLLQLSRLALVQNDPPGTNAAATAGGDADAASDASNGTPTPASSPDAGGDTDLKALLATLAQHGHTGADLAAQLAGDTSGAVAGSDQAAASNTDLSSSSDQTASSQTAKAGPADATNAAWLNATFLNLFNALPVGSPPGLPGANPAFVPPPPPNPAALLAAGDDDNGASASAGGNDGGQAAAMPQGPLADSNLAAANAGAQATGPYNFASQLSAFHQPAAQPGLPPAAQVIMQLTRGLKNGDSQMSLQLQPEDLGRIDIKLDIASDGKVQGTVVASNSDTLNLLLKDVRSLERALQDAGLRADPGSLQFALAGQTGAGTSGMAGNAFDQAGNGARSYVPAPNFSADTAAIPAAAADGTETYYIAPGRINLRV